MRILAIDPGPERSALLVYDTAAGVPVKWIKDDNDAIIDALRTAWGFEPPTELVIEMIASYGMPVGAEVFETCVWIGRFMQVWRSRTGALPERLFRSDVKLHICNSTKAKDANVRQALIDRYGGKGGKEKAIGRKAAPGPLYGMSGDCWAALAVAITAAERDE